MIKIVRGINACEGIMRSCKVIRFDLLENTEKVAGDTVVVMLQNFWDYACYRWKNHCKISI